MNLRTWEPPEPSCSSLSIPRNPELAGRISAYSQHLAARYEKQYQIAQIDDIRSCHIVCTSLARVPSPKTLPVQAPGKLGSGLRALANGKEAGRECQALPRPKPWREILYKRRPSRQSLEGQCTVSQKIRDCLRARCHYARAIEAERMRLACATLSRPVTVRQVQWPLTPSFCSSTRVRGDVFSVH